MNLTCRLHEMTREMIAAAGTELRYIDRLAVCTGPGSLTGLRVALSFFRAVALADNIPLIGIDLFTWSAQTLTQQGVSGPVRLMTPAFMNQAFVADITLPMGPLAKGGTSPEPHLGPRSAASDGRPTFSIRSIAEGATRIAPDPAVLNRIILDAVCAEAGLTGLLRVCPLYVVPSQAEMKWAQIY
ncbi:tRNA (adenosine(37)-N6)-threonylcarbamoyltransferase complex dimerization subunit type 1 TsaB [bacterium CG2_30_54_10]|nr:MAG: tRNA (adenosine(37)-N6)-threonylcarbamoyltransferase complex dimerization subunit type 1 TsaB [bacterium CG2_30_54_10]